MEITPENVRSCSRVSVPVLPCSRTGTMFSTTFAGGELMVWAGWVTEGIVKLQRGDQGSLCRAVAVA